MTDVRKGAHDAMVSAADKVSPNKGIVEKTKDAVCAAPGKIADAAVATKDAIVAAPGKIADAVDKAKAK